MAVKEARVPILHDDRTDHTHHESAGRAGRVGGGTAVVTSLIAGAAAGALAKTTIAPLDRAKINFQTKGFPATVLGVIPYAGVSFFTYDTLKQLYYQKMEGKHNALVNMCCGGAAGAVAQTASYPLDIVRRRMQTARPDAAGRYACGTIPGTVRHVYRSEGWRGFFKGLSMNWVKGPIAVGISFATYDAIRSSLRDLARALHW
ncbi:unnamed protein product [Chilo suppressalis]|uniref:Mitochondrial carrier protein n=1 Tax=Chilo suppressalis TaxID=168631 RepID=A0ABN8B8E3_CHISP|nr:unnamed protein product [Chilo suppressalis]